MAGDQATMKARIASELARSDLTGQIANAIADAIAEYQKERFRFSDVLPNAPLQFNTIALQAYYDATTLSAAGPALADIGNLLKFDYLNVNIGSTVEALDRVEPEVVRLYNQQNAMQGQPLWYAYEGNTIMISPIPDQPYLLTLGCFRLVAAPASDGEANNPWMTVAERLIRSRAKYEIALHVTRNPTMQQAMSPDAPGLNGGVVGATYRAWKSLKAETNRVTGRGRIRPMAF